jgi:hypothetical protein
MRLTFEREGGLAALPGLARPVTIDTDTLPADEAGRWQQLVTDACAWERSSMPAPRTGADRRTYHLELQDGARQLRLELHDPLPPELRPLVRALEALLKRR